MPITENFKVEAKESGAMPKDTYEAQLIDVNVVIVDNYEKTGKEKNFEFLFAVLENGYRGRKLTLRFVPTTLYISKKGKNKLYDVLEGLQGRELTEEETAYMDAQYVGNLTGKVVRLVVEINEKKNNVIAGFLNSKGACEAFNEGEVEKLIREHEEAKAKWESEDKAKSGESEHHSQEINVDEVFGDKPTDEELNASIQAIGQEDGIPIIQG